MSFRKTDVKFNCNDVQLNKGANNARRTSPCFQPKIFLCFIYFNYNFILYGL